MNFHDDDASSAVAPAASAFDIAEWTRAERIKQALTPVVGDGATIEHLRTLLGAVA